MAEGEGLYRMNDPRYVAMSVAVADDPQRVDFGDQHQDERRDLSTLHEVVSSTGENAPPPVCLRGGRSPHERQRHAGS
jgi:hypothetical protein